MADYIDRQVTIDKINERQRKLIYCFGFENDAVKIMDIAKSIVTSIPPAQPERMRAKWIVTTSLQEGQITWIDYRCSNCSHHREKPMNFCEVCGAKMGA